MNTTQDPEERPRQRATEGRRHAVLEILSHPDLRRVGDCIEIPSDGLIIGRDAPRWRNPRSGRSRALEDPCISRRQLRAGQPDAEGRIRVEGIGRRPVLVSTLDDLQGRPGGILAPGGLITVGDRLLLGLSYRRPIPSQQTDRFDMVGESVSLWTLRRAIARAADVSEPVFVQGEVGSGKELAARALHSASGRARSPFEAYNAATFAGDTARAELFGHARGAFTGADKHRRGAFGAAEGGTLFLDEVADLPSAAQVLLLRAIEVGEYRPVGGERLRRASIRLVSATHQDISRAVSEGSFREDLWTRLGIHTLIVPPLRERPFDIPHLFVHFLASHARQRGHYEAWFSEVTTLPPSVSLRGIRRMVQHDWTPGNVRALRAYVARAVALSSDEHFEFPPLPSRSSEGGAERHGGLVELLIAHGFNLTAIAKAMGVQRDTIYRRYGAIDWRSTRQITDEEIIEAFEQHGEHNEALHLALRALSWKGLAGRLAKLGLIGG